MLVYCDGFCNTSRVICLYFQVVYVLQYSVNQILLYGTLVCLPWLWVCTYVYIAQQVEKMKKESLRRVLCVSVSVCLCVSVSESVWYSFFVMFNFILLPISQRVHIELFWEISFLIKANNKQKHLYEANCFQWEFC